MKTPFTFTKSEMQAFLNVGNNIDLFVEQYKSNTDFEYSNVSYLIFKFHDGSRYVDENGQPISNDKCIDFSPTDDEVKKLIDAKFKYENLLFAQQQYDESYGRDDTIYNALEQALSPAIKAIQRYCDECNSKYNENLDALRNFKRIKGYNCDYMVDIPYEKMHEVPFGKIAKMEIPGYHFEMKVNKSKLSWFQIWGYADKFLHDELQINIAYINEFEYDPESKILYLTVDY